MQIGCVFSLRCCGEKRYATEENDSEQRDDCPGHDQPDVDALLLHLALRVDFRVLLRIGVVCRAASNQCDSCRKKNKSD